MRLRLCNQQTPPATQTTDVVLLVSESRSGQGQTTSVLQPVTRGAQQLIGLPGKTKPRVAFEYRGPLNSMKKDME